MLRLTLANGRVEARDSFDAAIQLLLGMPLAGKIVSLDAAPTGALLQREVVKTIDGKKRGLHRT